MQEKLRALIVHRSSNTLVQFFRYGFVSVAALTVDFGGLVFLKEVWHFNYLVAATISFLAGLLVNYALSAAWVFHSSKLENQWHEFAIFAAIGVVGLVLTDLILWLLTSGLHVYYIVSKAVATVIVYFWNFGIRKKYLFH